MFKNELQRKVHYFILCSTLIVLTPQVYCNKTESLQPPTASVGVTAELMQCAHTINLLSLSLVLSLSVPLSITLHDSQLEKVEPQDYTDLQGNQLSYECSITITLSNMPPYFLTSTFRNRPRNCNDYITSIMSSNYVQIKSKFQQQYFDFDNIQHI